MINLYDILDAADGQLFGEPSAQIFTSFIYDSRLVKKGDLYVALKTERGDGHHFMEDAVKAGAGGIMCTHPPSFDTEGVTVIVMRDVEAALMRWTKYILTKFSTTVIAVTGSNGKSTTCAAIAQVLNAKYKVHHQPINFPGRHGIPLALSQLTDEHQLVVLEIDPAYAGEMAEILESVPVSVGVVTTLTGVGVENYTNMMVPEADTLVSRLPKDGMAVLNYDVPAVRQLANRAQAPVMTVSVDRDGTSFGADLTAYNLVTSIDKTGFDVRFGMDRYVGKWVPLLGAHQLYAVLAALTVGLSFEVPMDEALAALTHLAPLPGRLRPLDGLNGCLLVDDSFSADIASFTMALEWIDAIRPKPSARDTVAGQISPHGVIYAVLGDLNGLNVSTEAKTLGDKLVETASVIVTEGDAAAVLARSALEHGIPLAQIHMTFSPQDTANSIKDLLGPKDVVLVVGNAAARMERVVAQLLRERDHITLLPRHDQLDVSETVTPSLYHSWVQLDLEAVAHNTRLVKQLIGENCRLMAVVKSDGYGHGAVAVGTTAILNGASYLGVATLEEAVALRKAGIADPILILNYLAPSAVSEVVRYNLTATLYDQATARLLNRIAHSAGKKMPIHVRVDAGRGGIGIALEELAVFFRALIRLESLVVEGIYITLDMKDRMEAEKQLTAFLDAVKMVRIGEFKYDLIHAAGTAALLHLPNARLDMVRVGAALYGIRSEVDLTLPKEYRPALTWKTSIAQVKRMAGEMGVDDQGIPFSTKARTVGILPVGYADGLHWGKTNSWQQVLIKGKRASVFGQVDSYQTLVDLNELDDVRPGEEVVLIGTQGEERLSVEEIAGWLGMRPAEVVSLLMARQPRVK